MTNIIKPSVQRVKISKARVLHAGPTSGKTTLAIALQKFGVTVYDSDRFLEAEDPTVWKRQLHRGLTPAAKVEFALLKQRALKEMVRALQANPKSLLFTNLWGEDAQLLVEEGFGHEGKLPVSFFLASPEEMSRRSAVRSVSGTTELPLQLTSKWVKAWEEKAGAVFFIARQLGDDQYLADVIDMTGHQVLGDIPWDDVIDEVTAITNKSTAPDKELVAPKAAVEAESPPEPDASSPKVREEK